jgi:hypothetical protein
MSAGISLEQDGAWLGSIDIDQGEEVAEAGAAAYV